MNNFILKFLFDGLGYRIIAKCIFFCGRFYTFNHVKIRKILIKSTLLSFKFLIDVEDPKQFKFPTKLLRLYGFYEPLTSIVLKNHVSEISNVLEIGSAYGYFTVQLAKYAKNGSVKAIEPNITYYNNYLIKNIKLNNLHNVKSYNQAIGGDSIIDVKGINIKPINFKKFVIEECQNEPIDFIFIDVDARDEEGNIIRNEIIILRQIFKYYKKLKKPKIFLETKDLDKIYEDIKANNYEIKTITRRHFILLPMIN